MWLSVRYKRKHAQLMKNECVVSVREQSSGVRDHHWHVDMLLCSSELHRYFSKKKTFCTTWHFAFECCYSNKEMSGHHVVGLGNCHCFLFFGLNVDMKINGHCTILLNMWELLYLHISHIQRQINHLCTTRAPQGRSFYYLGYFHLNLFLHHLSSIPLYGSKAL